jgi:hypothetical protein
VGREVSKPSAASLEPHSLNQIESNLTSCAPTKTDADLPTHPE